MILETNSKNKNRNLSFMISLTILSIEHKCNHMIYICAANKCRKFFCIPCDMNRGMVSIFAPCTIFLQSQQAPIVK